MRANTTNLLAAELDFYAQHRDEFIQRYTNRYLLIKGAELIGNFSTRGEAVGEGVYRFGQGPFLVRLSGEDTITAVAPAITLGLL